jgi:peptidyl-prolyl cis-trans isomerase SurA
MARMTYRPFFLVLALVLSLCAPAWAQRLDHVPDAEASSNRIAAVVNEDVITTMDIEARLRLSMLAAGLPDTPEVRSHLLAQILRNLIDEQLEMQEAKRLDIVVTKSDVTQALDKIAQQNGIPGSMLDYVAQHGVPPSSLESQIRAGLAWGKVVQRELRPRVDVGDDEVEAAIARMRANAGKEEFQVSEIFLPVDNPNEEAQVRQVADRLTQQLRGGANFPAVARQFSQASSAATGGDIGWIQEGQLPPELNRTLAGMKQGDISEPVRSTSGFHILGLRDKRVVSLGDPKDLRFSIQQAFRPYSGPADHQALLAEAAKLRGGVKTCADLKPALAKLSGWNWQDLGEVNPAKAPAWLIDKVRDVSVNSSSEPLAADKGVLVLFVCGKSDGSDKGVNRDLIVNAIGSEKLELQARRLQRDLRRNAFLDIRLAKS